MEKHKDYLIKSEILVKRSPIHQYGVFADKDFSSNEIIEECPVIIYQQADQPSLGEVYNKEFIWDDENHAVCLGYGSMYNHAQYPNAIYELNKDDNTVSFIAKRPISKGQEIFVDYGEDWFGTRGMEEKAMVSPEKQNTKIFFQVFSVVAVLFILSKVFPI